MTEQEIYDMLMDRKEQVEQLSSLTSPSDAANYKLMLRVMAYGAWTVLERQSIHEEEINQLIREQKIGSLNWYRNKALDFQYGFDLIKDTDVFDNTGATEEQIQASKIIDYAACVESDDGSKVIVKIAKEVNDDLQPVTPDEFSAVIAYMEEIRFAGVDMNVINFLPDRLKLNIRIKRDALVLDENGVNIITGKESVKDAIKAFLKQLPFNGELSLQKLEEAILKVPGVVDLQIDFAQSSWIGNDGLSYGDFVGINMSVIPVSGYFSVNFDQEDEMKSELSYVV